MSCILTQGDQRSDRTCNVAAARRLPANRLSEEIDDRVKAFLDRPIEGGWPYIWLDATYVKVRRNQRIVSVGVIIAFGINTDGRLELLSMDIGPSEAGTFWTKFLRRRGLRGTKPVISDAHDV